MSASSGERVIQVRDLRKRYRRVNALKGVTFHVTRGETFALLGPNGAGKTTALEIIEGLRGRDSGTVEVLGLDPEKAGLALNARIGVCLQSTSLFPQLTVLDLLRLFGRLFTRSVDPIPLIDRLGLGEHRDAKYDQLSGGHKQRVALAIALINDPEIVFLDEPSAGIDAHARRAIYDTADELKLAGKTIVMTTHFIDDAQRTCDRVAVIDRGMIVAEGTPAQLRAAGGGDSTVQITTLDPMPSTPERWIAARFDSTRTTLTLESSEAAADLAGLLAWLSENRLRVVEAHVNRPSLEEVLLALTRPGASS